MIIWHCTQQGRVVYDRKPHHFLYTDVLRILKKIEVPQVYEINKRIHVIKILVDVFRKNVWPGWKNIFVDTEEVGILGNLLEEVLTFVKELSDKTIEAD